jgi:hypothetical protein
MNKKKAIIDGEEIEYDEEEIEGEYEFIGGEWNFFRRRKDKLNQQ